MQRLDLYVHSHTYQVKHAQNKTCIPYLETGGSLGEEAIGHQVVFNFVSPLKVAQDVAEKEDTYLKKL